MAALTEVVTRRITLWQNIKIPIGLRMGLPADLADGLQRRGLVEIIEPAIIEQEKVSEEKEKTKKKGGK